MMHRPSPPEIQPDAFCGAPRLVEWMRGAFLDNSSPLYNADHEHLQVATLGALWTSCDWMRRGRFVMATAEAPAFLFGISGWRRDRLIYALTEWLEQETVEPLPDFLITIHVSADDLDHASFCALLEHELYHCGQKRDDYGNPMYTKEGIPRWCMRGHDVEEFVGVVARYGADASLSPVRQMADAATGAPLIAEADIGSSCGICLAA